jgi:hypothetical protein
MDEYDIARGISPELQRAFDALIQDDDTVLLEVVGIDADDAPATSEVGL